MTYDPIINQNINNINDNNFAFSIKELPMVSLFSQSFSVPGIHLGRATVPTPLVDYNIPGEKIEFEDLTITFLVDEHILNYIEIFNWMTALGFPQDTDQFKAIELHNTPFNQMSDIIMTITSNKFNPHTSIHFVDCFPIDLSPLDFTNINVTVSPLIATVAFEYSYYYFQPIV